MSGTPPDPAHPPAEINDVDDREQTPEQNALPRYRVELESINEGIRRVHHVHADSAENAVTRAREADHWPSSGPGSDPRRFRAAEVTEENASSEARHERNARRRYLNTIVETGLTALGEPVPARSEQEFFDVLCDFFTRTIVLPGHSTFPADDDRLLSTDDAAVVMARLLETHFARHGLELTRTTSD